MQIFWSISIRVIPEGAFACRAIRTACKGAVQLFIQSQRRALACCRSGERSFSPRQETMDHFIKIVWSTKCFEGSPSFACHYPVVFRSVSFDTGKGFIFKGRFFQINL